MQSEDAVDISLQRLMRSRFTQRLQKEHRLTSSPYANRAIIDDELGRVRGHALYAMIKERMTDYLRNAGYETVCLHPTQDPKALMLSLDAESVLDTFMHSLRVSFPRPNDEIVTFLEDHEAIFGQSIAAPRGVDRYDVALPFLIQLLCEYPDDFEPLASAVEFVSERE